MRVFISYRREDTSGQAGRLYDALAKALGPDNVFMDVDTIDIGVEFKDAIESAVTSCDVLFAMIGPRWLTVADSRGERRLSRADDYVRLEIEAALARNIRVVPALIAGASMPSSDDLPATLVPLARRNALEMADGPRWQYDVSRLVNLLERIRAGESHPEPAPPLESEAFMAEAPAGFQPAADAEETIQATGGTTHQHAESPAHERAASVAQPAPSSTGEAAIPPLSASVGGTGSTPPAGGTGGGGGGDWQGGSGGHGAGGQGPGGRRSGGLSDAPRWLVALAGLGIVSLLALALVGAYQLGGGRSADSSGTVPSTPGITADTTTAPTTPTTPTTTDSTDVPPNADADQKKLWLAIPKTIRRGACKFANTEHAGGVATINCDYNDPKHGRTLIHLDRFIDANHLQPIYKLHGPGEVLARGGSPDPQLKAATGGCNRTRWRGEGPWSHETGGGVMGPVSGRYACYQAPGQCDLVKKMQLTDLNGSTCFVIVWTDDLANMFVKAEQQRGVHAGIASFYDFWHHQFG
jgi:TIR domain-containing protein